MAFTNVSYRSRFHLPSSHTSALSINIASFCGSVLKFLLSPLSINCVKINSGACELTLIAGPGLPICDMVEAFRFFVCFCFFVLIIQYSLYLEYDRPLIPDASGQAG
ncbi:hypothetical protein BDD12DRAFT_233138 [Trichophaea hybrida]|nr:hypothetical protein BDD12DRAFT_233138 [Trichophaea hybrida]